MLGRTLTPLSPPSSGSPLVTGNTGGTTPLSPPSSGSPLVTGGRLDCSTIASLYTSALELERYA